MINGVVPGGRLALVSPSKAGVTSYTVPTGYVYYIDWLVFRYVADATVISRGLKILLTTTDALTHVLAYANAAASETATVSYGLVAGENTPSSSHWAFGGPNQLVLYPGQKISVSITDGQAGDAWQGEMVYHVAPLAVS
jgi:hypothetical protein